MTKTDFGKEGEKLAAAALESAGMEIIARNFRSKYGEIDIIAFKGETIVFTEVKASASYGLEDLQYAVDSRKQRKIIKTAKYFLSENRKYSRMSIRFDVVFISRTPAGCQTLDKCQTPSGCQVTHLASAFTEGV